MGQRMKVLAISAHVDDVELSMGGTLLKHRDAGDEIYIAVLKANENITAPSDTRRKEQEAALDIIKAKLMLFSYPLDIERTVGMLDAVEPDILYFPFEMDTHQDHVLASQVGFAVARRIQITVLQYLSITSHSYYPNYIRVIDIEEKKKLVAAFASQVIRRPKFMEVMEAQNRFFGSLIPGDGHHAEGFVLFRMVQF